jgi:DNA-binding LacI/PurR family transcriptional regulator
MSEHFRVPLTTVRQPKLRLGAAAMESCKSSFAASGPNPSAPGRRP